MTRIAALRAEHSTLLAESRALLDNPKASPADAAKAEGLIAKADGISSMVRALERVAAIKDAPPPAAEFGVPTARIESTFDNEVRLIRAFCNVIYGIEGGEMPAAIRDEWNRRFTAPQAAAGNTPGTSGGYTVAPAFLKELLVAMRSQGAMRSVADCFETDTGAALTVPEVNDLAQSGRLLTAENTQLATATDIPFAAGSLGAWTFVSDVLPVSNQLIQDSAFDFGALMLQALGSRLARAENPYFTTGTGAGQPQGVVNGAAAGPAVATGSATSFIGDNLIDLMHSVDPAYRPGASWMMHDTTLQAFRKLKDGNGRPLFRSYDNTAPASSTSGGTILGYPVIINQDMPVMAANAKSVLFGNFKSYKIRTVVDLRLTMLRERYADSNQVGFIAAIRSDGRLTSAAAPIKYLQNSAT